MTIKDVVSIIKTSKTVVLSTVTETGYPESRALLNLANEKKHPKLKEKASSNHENTATLYFTTNTSSRKMIQLHANPKVSLYFCIPDKFQGVCAIGEMERWRTLLLKQSSGKQDGVFIILKAIQIQTTRCWNEFAVHKFQ